MKRGILVATIGTVLLAVAAWSSALRAEDVAPGDPVDFSLEETSGITRTLVSVRGHVVVLFYEDREHSELNYEFKRMLHRFMVDNGLSNRVTTFAIANVGGVEDGLLRDIARGAIRAVAQQYGIQILVDWDRILVRAPFSFRDRAANLALIDPAGRLRWRHVGVVGEVERRAFFRAFRALLRG